MPVGETAGPALNSAALVLPVMLKVSVCAASSGGPGLMAVAQFAHRLRARVLVDRLIGTLR